MTTTPLIVHEAETVVREAAADLMRVSAGECLCCYLWRQLADGACDCALRYAVHFRDVVAPRATALRERLGLVGAYCDCEVFMNGYMLHPRLWTPERGVVEDGVVFFVGAEPPDEPPPCAGVRRGSVRPCTLGTRVRRW